MILPTSERALLVGLDQNAKTIDVRALADQVDGFILTVGRGVIKVEPDGKETFDLGCDKLYHDRFNLFKFSKKPIIGLWKMGTMLAHGRIDTKVSVQIDYLKRLFSGTAYKPHALIAWFDKPARFKHDNEREQQCELVGMMRMTLRDMQEQLGIPIILGSTRDILDVECRDFALTLVTDTSPLLCLGGFSPNVYSTGKSYSIREVATFSQQVNEQEVADYLSLGDNLFNLWQFSTGRTVPALHGYNASWYIWNGTVQDMSDRLGVKVEPKPEPTLSTEIQLSDPSSELTEILENTRVIRKMLEKICAALQGLSE